MPLGTFFVVMPTTDPVPWMMTTSAAATGIDGRRIGGFDRAVGHAFRGDADAGYQAWGHKYDQQQKGEYPRVHYSMLA